MNHSCKLASKPVQLRLLVCKLMLMVCRLGAHVTFTLTCGPVRPPREVTVISKEKIKSQW